MFKKFGVVDATRMDDRCSRERVTLTSGRMRDDDKQLPAVARKMVTINKRKRRKFGKFEEKNEEE